MITIRHETPYDVARREALLDAAFGDCRFTKTAERLRADRLPAEGLSFVASADGRLVGTVRLWSIAAGAGRPALLLGPLAVASDFRQCGIGAELMRHALEQAEARGHQSVLLVGDAPYYGRFGFTAATTGALSLPGPYARERLLARELVPGALQGARGLVRATGRSVPKSVVAERIPRAARAA
ncbi:MAG TPA: N-acetyltransferase [Xanthobacteraceae bacterium]|jgi:predicted N-acetyltransferase YhbS